MTFRHLISLSVSPHLLAAAAIQLATLPPLIAFQLCIADEKYLAHGWKVSATGQWLGSGTGKPVNFFRQPYFDQLWLRILDPILSSLCFFAFPSSAQEHWRDRSFWRICSTLGEVGLKQFFMQPLEVSSIHYALQPPGSVLNFQSTLEAMSRLARYNPFYLWSGLLESIVTRGVQAVIMRETNNILGRKLNNKRFGRIAVDLIRMGLDMALVTPLRTISSRAMGCTPLLRNLPGIVQYPKNPIEHALQIWRQEGIAGFYRGFPFVIATRAIFLVLMSSWQAFSANRRYHRFRNQFSFVIPAVAALSFAADLTHLQGKLPWEQAESNSRQVTLESFEVQSSQINLLFFTFLCTVLRHISRIMDVSGMGTPEFLTIASNSEWRTQQLTIFQPNENAKQKSCRMRHKQSYTLLEDLKLQEIAFASADTFLPIFGLASPQLAANLCILDANYNRDMILASTAGTWLTMGSQKPIPLLRRNFFSQFWIQALTPIFSSWYQLNVQRRLQHQSQAYSPSSLPRSLSMLAEVALRTIFLHPFEVASLHYMLQPPGTTLNYRSATEAMASLVHCSPIYLWTGLLESLVARCAQALVTRDLAPAISAQFPGWTVPSYMSDLLRASLDVLLVSPFRVLATQAMCNTPLLRALPGFVQYSASPLEHIQGIWRTEGFFGFYRGAALTFAARVLGIVGNRIWRKMYSFVSRNRVQPAVHLGFQVSLGFVAFASLIVDLSNLQTRSYPWELEAISSTSSS